MSNPRGLNGLPPIRGPELRNPVYAAPTPRRDVWLRINGALWDDVKAVAKHLGISVARFMALIAEEAVVGHQRQVRERDASERPLQASESEAPNGG